MSGSEAPAGWGRSRHNPRLIMTIGLYSSASTWAFNVVRELMIAQHGEARVCALYSDLVATVLDNRQALGRYTVWKMHFGEAAWDVFAQLSDPTILLTVRDPRDAILSLVNRFNSPLEASAQSVARCCNRALQCAHAGYPVLRYEDRFFADPAVVGTIAEYIGAAVDADTRARIFDRYSTGAVRALAAQVEALPAERVKGDPAIDLYDEVTQIHRGHIGDGSVGKWRRQLTAEQQQAITARFAPFLNRFGYI
jgi:hypothetical protein